MTYRKSAKKKEKKGETPRLTLRLRAAQRLLVETVTYCKTLSIWPHGPCVEVAALRSNTSCKASVLVFLTEEAREKKIVFGDRFTIIWPKMRVDENCTCSGCVYDQPADGVLRDYSGYSIVPIFD